MGNTKYTVGTKVICNDVKGVIIDNFKSHGDICIQWSEGFKASHDQEWLDENCEVVHNDSILCIG